jgi:hypothetical protein
LGRQFTAQANAYAFALQLEIRKAVLRDQLYQLAQLFHVKRRLRATLWLLLLRLILLRMAAASAITVSALRLVRLLLWPFVARGLCC